MFDLVGILALTVVTALALWAASQSRRAKNAFLKWSGFVLAGFVALVCAAGLVLSVRGYYTISFPHPAAASAVKVAATPELVARGAKFAAACAGCHSPNEKVPLVGVNFFAGGPPFGTLYAPNLTPAGEIRDWSDGEIIRAIREGVHKSGRALLIMPSENLKNMSDSDVHAVVAYLRSEPASGAASPPAKLSVLGAAIVGVGMFQTAAQPAITTPIVAPTEGRTPEYGKYLVSVLGCTTCHGENLAGRKPGLGPPPGPNLTMIVPKWSLDEFTATFRTGVDPYKHEVLPSMPWKVISAFSNDDDLASLHAYLHGLPEIAGPPK